MRHLSVMSALAVVLLLSTADSSAAPKPKPEAKPDAKKQYTLDDINRRITAAHEWLVDHQGFDGRWSLKEFSSHSTRVRANKTHNLKWVLPGEAAGDAAMTENADVAGTAMALLCFLGSGYDHTEGDYKEFVANAVKYLLKTQGASGCFGDEQAACMVHDSAVATMALAEAFGLSGDEKLKPALEKGVAFLLGAQNDGGGWRYGVKPGDSDTQMTGWCLLALKAAKMAEIEADYTKSWTDAGKFFETCSAVQDGTLRTGYMMVGGGSPRNRATTEWAHTPDMDAVHVLCRLLSGDKKWDIKNKDLKKQSELFNLNPPKWEEKKVDLAYWYYATLAMYQVGGKEWDKWLEALLPVLMDSQRGWLPEDKDSFEAVLDEFGSWDAIDAWYSTGGRIWSTFACTQMLQAVARYKRLNK